MRTLLDTLEGLRDALEEDLVRIETDKVYLEAELTRYMDQLDWYKKAFPEDFIIQRLGLIIGQDYYVKGLVHMPVTFIEIEWDERDKDFLAVFESFGRPVKVQTKNLEFEVYDENN